MIYFSSDTHFGSERTLELSRRPFSSVEEMDNELIKLWNNTVRKNDTVWHLGDFGNYEICKKLNGKIHLIRGNYEVKDGLSESKLLSYGFISVTDEALISFRMNEIPELTTLYLCHEPEKCIKNSNRVMNLFGHIHGRQMIKKYGIDVGTDAHHFRPISEDDVRFYLNAIKNFYDDNVFL